MPCATSARFYDPPTSLRTRVRISGSNLKLGATTADVLCSATDASGNPAPEKQARKILSSMGTQCEAELPYGDNFAMVRVKMRCSDGSWSAVLEVKR
jgi:hypothetical protein